MMEAEYFELELNIFAKSMIVKTSKLYFLGNWKTLRMKKNKIEEWDEFHQ